MLTWYLFMFNLYIGPMHESSCNMAAATLKSEGVVCMQADYVTACPVPNYPNVYTICPHFIFPEVTIK